MSSAADKPARPKSILQAHMKRPREAEPPHIGLIRWLRSRGADLDGLEIRESPGGDLGVFATRPFEPGAAIGLLPSAAIIDPVAVLHSDDVARAALAQGGSEPFAFWLALASMAQQESCGHREYLAALPREAPDPTGWPAAQRQLLAGTPLAGQVEAQRRLLADEFARVAPTAAPRVPFDVQQGRCERRRGLEAAVRRRELRGDRSPCE